jgi:hypothetical protein
MELSDDSEFHRVNVALSERGFDGGDQREQPVERDHDHEEPEGQPRRHPAGHRANAIYGREGVLEIERLLRLVGQPRVDGISARSQPDDERGHEQEMFAANLDKSSQVSFKHAKPTNRSLSRLSVSYSVRKSVRRIIFLTEKDFTLSECGLLLESDPLRRHA